MTARVDLRLEGPMDHLRIAWQTGETLLSVVPFEDDPKGTRYNILLAMQELLTNVFRHGYAEVDTPLVDLRFEIRDSGFEFQIRDRARQFDPTVGASPRRMDADADEDADEMPADEGGYGLVIVKAIMDELEYVREDGWNTVRAFKSLRSGVVVGASDE